MAFLVSSWRACVDDTGQIFVVLECGGSIRCHTDYLETHQHTHAHLQIDWPLQQQCWCTHVVQLLLVGGVHPHHQGAEDLVDILDGVEDALAAVARATITELAGLWELHTSVDRQTGRRVQKRDNHLIIRAC